MFCTYCKTARVENEAPCPYCGAPSPLLGKSRNNSRGMSMPDAEVAENPATASNTLWNAQTPQLSFESPMPAWSPSNTPAQNSMPAWPQPDMAQSAIQVQNPFSQSPGQALVPYQGIPSETRQPTMALQILPEQAAEHLLPAISQAPQPVYVAPMYTKPRPIIPKYRAISGLLSVLIIALLLCGAAGYYAQVTGKLNAIGVFFGTTSLPDVNSTTARTLPNPPDQTANDHGVAYATIPVATTTSAIDPKSNFPRNEQTAFTVDQTFYVTFTVLHPNKNGTVLAKWYTNNQFYKQTLDKTVINANETQNGSIEVLYAVPTEGAVELYWNNQLAQRLYFVVR